MKTHLYFKLFSNCLLTKGANRSLILDLQRESFTTIPDTMADVLTDFASKKTVGELYALYGVANKDIIDDYLDFLVGNELGFFSESAEFDLFPDLDQSFKIPALISNAIVELSAQTIPFFEKIISELEALHCEHIQLISYDLMTIPELILLLQQAEHTDFRSVALVLAYTDSLAEFIPAIRQYTSKVTELTLHGTALQATPMEDPGFRVSSITTRMETFVHCGVVDSAYFNVNKSKVLESLHYNSCLHRKMAIDRYGMIRNCPATTADFGNIKDTTLMEAYHSPHFKEYWSIAKDQITVCKDCEYRHVCTDCRAYLETPGDAYSKPLKCGYDPYTNVWEEWSTSPLKQQGIAFYGMKALIVQDNTAS